MPKSKRTKLISLTRTQPKTRSSKTKLLLKLQRNLQKYSRIGIISYHNLNSSGQFALRKWLGSLSNLVFGKKTILKLALNSLEDSPDFKNITMLSDFIEGSHVAMVFSNLPVSSLKEKLENFNSIEFAQPQSVSPANIVLTKGDAVFKMLSTSNDAYLRTLGLDILVRNGKLLLESDFLLAKKGEKLNNQQCKILKLLGIKVGKVSTKVKAVYDKEFFRLEKFI